MTPVSFLLSGSHSLRRWKRGTSRHAWAAVLCVWRGRNTAVLTAAWPLYQGWSPQRLQRLHQELFGILVVHYLRAQLYGATVRHSKKNWNKILVFTFSKKYLIQRQKKNQQRCHDGSVKKVHFSPPFLFSLKEFFCNKIVVGKQATHF